MMKRRHKNDAHIKKMLAANNVIFFIAIVLNYRFPWLMYFALIFWFFTLICLIRRDRENKSVSFVTIAYGVLAAIIAIFVLFVTIYSTICG